MINTKKLATIAAGLLLVGAVTTAPAIVAAAPASASASCWGYTCNGQNPYTNGCAGNIWTSGWYQTWDGSLELVYSYDCNANWTVYNGVVDVAYTTNSNGDYGPDIINNDGGYTAMVDGTYLAWGCVHVPDVNGYNCTGKF